MTSNIKGGRLTRTLGRAALVGAVVAALVTGGSSAAWAWWTASASVSGTVTTTTPTAPTPAGIACTNTAGGLQVSVTPAPAQNPLPSGVTLSFRLTVTMANGATTQSTVSTSPYDLQVRYGLEVPNNGQGGGFTMTVQTVYTSESGAVVTSAAFGSLTGQIQGNGNNRVVRCVA